MISLCTTVLQLIALFLSLVIATFAEAQSMPSSDGSRIDMPPIVVEDHGGVPLLLRIPAKLIANSVDRDFEHKAPVDQVLLGTHSHGTSHCKGKVTCRIENNLNGVSIVCCITGIVESVTCGTNGPAIIRSTASTEYLSSKRLTFDGKIFSSEPASVSSTTHLTISQIESTLPRLMGRIVKRVAAKKAQETKAQVEAIIKCQTEQELCQRIDADFEMRIADLNKQIASRLVILKYFPGKKPQMLLRSREDGVELALGHPRHPMEHNDAQPPIGEFVEVWLPRNENLVANGTMTALLFNKAPAWLNSYLSESPLFQKPDDRKWKIEFGEKWIVLKLSE